MARIRTIKPEFFTNSTTGRLSGQATKLYLGLQNHSDDYGVIRSDVAQFKAVVMPYEKSERVVEKALAELERAGADENPHGLIVPFHIGTKAYLWLPFFTKHQKVDRPGTPVIDGWNSLSTPLDYADSTNDREDSSNVRDRAAGDRSGEERKGNNHVDLGDRPKTDIEKVWDAYREHHPRASGTPQRRALIKRRLEHYDAATLVDAVHGNHADAYCNGENPAGKEYHSLELILRGGDHIEKYAALAPRSNGNGHRTAEDFDEMERQAVAAGYQPGTSEDYDEILARHARGER